MGCGDAYIADVGTPPKNSLPSHKISRQQAARARPKAPGSHVTLSAASVLFPQLAQEIEAPKPSVLTHLGNNPII
jgi:hypothetical protein